MSLFNVFKISGSAMSAQSLRLNTVASNLANADSVVSSDGKPYQAKQVVFKAVQDAASNTSTVQVDRVIEDTKPGKMVYDPKNPMANSDGYLTMPNVNVTEEMVNMISASRAYQNNVETMNAAKSMLLKTLNIGQ
ncbi:MAG: flagellar basal body rod protein FlgC [Methylophilus sp.]|jgi:flagellar basal-body rod protein FlgC|uniref:flagellar basal body rod protein FlgC n=1 Tax=Methylophilus sp. TaxID=29541 RepID=UPI002CF140CA|nr:flagellar basal body rod protein FlgC [Methylophilus sp.]HSI45930.1 flagellar basal body rod protein FlgC [Methylophilus sp.]